MKDYDKISAYLKSGSNINTNLYDGNTAVTLSSMHKDIKFLTFLSSNGGNLSVLNKNGESILYWGATGKNIEYLQTVKSIMSTKDFDLLLKKNTKTGRTPIHAAVLYSGNVDVISWLIEQKVDINAQDSNGQTAMHYATAIRKWDSLITLLKKNGNISIKDSSGQTVEDYILERGDVMVFPQIYPYLSPIGKRILETRLAGTGFLTENKESKEKEENTISKDAVSSFSKLLKKINNK
jgi:ankyrin repeat protein